MSSITIVSDDATIWSVTYERHYDDRNSFIIQATGVDLFKLFGINLLTPFCKLDLSIAIQQKYFRL